MYILHCRVEIARDLNTCPSFLFFAHNYRYIYLYINMDK